MKFSLAAVIKKTLSPLVYINGAAMIFSGCWLLYLGAPWGVLWTPIILVMVCNLLFPIVLIPAAFFSGLIPYVDKRWPWAGMLAMALTVGYFAAVMSFYVVYIVDITYPLMHDAFYWAALGWMASASMMPWAAFAMRDRANVFFTGFVFYLQIAVALTFTAIIVFHVGFWGAFTLLFVTLSVLVFLQGVFEKYFPELSIDTSPAAGTDADAV